jgi:hypothetical protein
MEILSIVSLVSLLVQPVFSQAADALADPGAKHRSLKVLYAGKAGMHRETEFGAYLASALAFVRGNRGRLFFSNVGGYRWFVDPRGKRSSAARSVGGVR